MPARRRGGGNAATGGTFRPTKANLYAVVKAIFHPSTNAGVEADDENLELDVAGGTGDGSGGPPEASAADVTARSGTGYVSARRLPATPAVPAKASNTDVDAESDDSDYMTVLKTFRAIARKVRNASTTARGIVELGTNTELDAGTDAERVASIAGVVRIVNRLVPAVFRAGNAAVIAAAKLGTGTPGIKTALFNGVWRQPAFDDLTGTAADNQIPPTIARDSEIADSVTGLAFAGNVLTGSRRSGTNPIQVNLGGLVSASGRGLDQIGFWRSPTTASNGNFRATGIILPDDPPDDKIYLASSRWDFIDANHSPINFTLTGRDIKAIPVAAVGGSSGGRVLAYDAASASVLYGGRLASGELLLRNDNGQWSATDDYFALFDPEGKAPVGGYLWFNQNNPLTTPAFSLTTINQNTQIQSTDADGYQVTLLDTVAPKLTAGAPITVDYEGAILLANGTGTNRGVEVSLGYRTFDGVAAKQTTQWRRFVEQLNGNEEISIPADVFSHKQLLLTGVAAPTDSGGMYALTEADIASGIPVKIILRIRGFRQDFSRRADFTFDHLEWLQPQVVSYQIGLHSAAPPVHPSISEFTIRGNLSPAAGQINETYAYSYAVAQSSHLSALRLVRFSGTDAAPSAVTVLATIPAASYHGGNGQFTLSGFSLSAGETETVRLEGYATGQNPATDQPVTYHDARVTAHAPAAAAYHWGRIIVNSNDADAAATAGRVVFADDDLVTGSALAASYAATPPDTGTDLYQFYLAVADGSPEPVGWNSGGLIADAAFQAPVTRTISGTAYKFWVLRASLARESGDGSINYEPRTA